jgi:hypothetical protein
MRLSRRLRVVEAEVYKGCRDAESYRAQQEREQTSQEWHRQLWALIATHCEEVEATMARIIELQDKGKALAREGKELTPGERDEGYRLAAGLADRVHAAQPDPAACPKISMNFHPRGLPDEVTRLCAVNGRGRGGARAGGRRERR